MSHYDFLREILTLGQKEQTQVCYNLHAHYKPVIGILQVWSRGLIIDHLTELQWTNYEVSPRDQLNLWNERKEKLATRTITRLSREPSKLVETITEDQRTQYLVSTDIINKH